MCELTGFLAAHKKRRHLAISVGLVIFAFLTIACGRSTLLSTTQATPGPAADRQTTAQETTGSTRPQPELPQDPKFTHVTVDHGLSDQLVLAVLQDSAGFMWFGTINGLNRYDGYHIVEYRNDPADPHSLSNNSIEELHEDRSGTLWVATRSGLNAFDRRTEQFTRYLHDPENPLSLSNDTVMTICEDRSGVLWIGTLDGLSRFDHATGTFTVYRHDPDDPNTLSNASVLAIHEDQSGVLWVGTFDGLNRFDHATGAFTAYRHDPEDPRSLSHNSIYGIYSDRSGALWIATNGGGINRFDHATGNFTAYRHDPDEPNSLGNDQVDGFFEDASGALWVSTFGGGVSVIDPDRETITTLRHASDNPASLSHDVVADIAVDRSGSIWLATQGGGVAVYNPWQQAFTNYQRDDEDANSLASDKVWSVYEDQEGVLWIGTRDHGLERFDRRNGQIDHYPADPQSPQSLGHPFVTAIEQDPAGALWVGTWGGGLYRLDAASGNFSAFRHDPADPQSLISNIISDLFVDASGQLWIGTIGGLSLFDQKSGTFTSYRHDPDNPQSLSQDVVMRIAEDRHGSLWVATFSGGLNRMEPDTGQVTRYLHDTEDPASLGSNSLTFLHIDRSGVLWLGTASAGLDRLNPDSDSFIHYREGDGLASDRIVSILEDGDADDPAAGNLWIATGNGLSKLDRDRKTFRSYGVSDGLLLTEFSRHNHKTRSGELLIGSSDGVIAFDPADLTDDPYIPPIVFTDFLLANEPVKIGVDSPLQQAIDLTDVIELTYADQKISIEFAALSYGAPSQNRYRYRLEGFEEEWIEVDSTRRLVTYTNLEPGRYVFRVTGSNGDGVWNELGREVTLVIAPPWWETWWSRGGAALLLVGLVAGGFVRQRQSTKRRERRLENIVEERTAHLQEEIEQRERAEMEMKTSEEKYRTLVEEITDVIYAVDMEGALTYVSPAIEPFLGVPAEQLIGKSFVKYVVPEDLDRVSDGIQEILSGNPPGPNEYRIMRPSGEIRWIRVSSRPTFSDGRITGLQGVMTDITEAKRLEEQHEREVAAAERQRLARELHDSATQTLYGIDLYSNATQEALSSGKIDTALENIRQIQDLSHSALADMRLLIFELQPPILIEKGLAKALRERLDLVEARAGFNTILRVTSEEPIPRAIEAELYAIATEALNNSLKHAQAGQVSVILAVDEHDILLEISDDGVGFDPEAPEKSAGFGLSNMRERIERIGGTLILKSAPGEGTTVKAEVTA